MRNTALLLVFIFVTGCRFEEKTFDQTITHGTEPPTIESLAWLEGKWISEDKQGRFIEEWSKANGHLEGQGKTVSGNDTTNMEKLRILQDSAGGIRYVVNFPDREVRFYLKTTTHTQSEGLLSYDESHGVTFVNDTNDFPSQIVYRRQNKDSLYITLTGNEDGRSMAMTLRMKKQ